VTDKAPLAPCDDPPGGRAFWLRADDGVRIRVALWPGPRGVVLIAPGRTEYIEKYGLVIGDLARAGWGALVVDWRGQGLADRALPDPLVGHVGAFAQFQLDLRAVLAFARDRELGPMPWLAHSMGGCITLRAMVDGQRPPVVVFSAPMWGLNQTPMMRRAMVAMAHLARPLGRDGGYLPTTGPTFGVASLTFDVNPLTRDRAQFERMKRQITEDPRLALGGPSLRWGAAALAEMALLERAPSPPVAAVIGLGGAEKIVCPQAIRARAARWPEAELVDYPGAEHELMMERPLVRDDFLSRALALFGRATGSAGD
jgi:lysophospholipase